MSDDTELDLRGSIKNLKNVAKILNPANLNFEMNALAKFAEGITIGKPVKPPEDILKPLLEKFLRGERNFSSREIRALPFIIYDKQITFSDTAEILTEMNFSRTSHLRRIVSVYLLNYNNSNKTELLRHELNGLRGVDSASLQKIFAARDKLFGNERLTNMAKLFSQKVSVKASLETIGLSAFYKTSNFIGEALKFFFRSDVANISAQINLLTELDAEYDTYKNIFPYIADVLIQSVDRAGFDKKKCIEIFYRRLGDPRFGYKRFNWNNVSQKSKDIFLRWLVEEDLEIFFKIINQTAVDKMWRYREKFWRAYLPFIKDTWIFLGSDAKRIARRLGGQNIAHGILYDASNNQSVLVFKIDDYIFSDWSHNGPLRVYKAEFANHFFGAASVNRQAITENFIREWIHSSAKTYYWQRTVSDWLGKNCGIYKQQTDWEVTN